MGIVAVIRWAEFYMAPSATTINENGGVVAVIKGIEDAQRTLDDFDWCQSEENRRVGWRYFLEETDLRPGMDPEKATKLRQVRVDLHES